MTRAGQRVIAFLMAVSAMIGVVGCATDGATAAPTGDAPPPPLAEISRTDLPPDADQAITACNVSWPQIGGIGLVPRARDVSLYAPVAPQTLEIQSDDPAWVVQIRGQYHVPLMQDTELDPTCVVIDRIQYVFGTGAGWDARGEFIPARDVWHPVGRLPPLGP